MLHQPSNGLLKTDRPQILLHLLLWHHGLHSRIQSDAWKLTRLVRRAACPSILPGNFESCTLACGCQPPSMCNTITEDNSFECCATRDQCPQRLPPTGRQGLDIIMRAGPAMHRCLCSRSQGVGVPITRKSATAVQPSEFATSDVQMLCMAPWLLAKGFCAVIKVASEGHADHDSNEPSTGAGPLHAVAHDSEPMSPQSTTHTLTLMLHRNPNGNVFLVCETVLASCPNMKLHRPAVPYCFPATATVTVWSAKLRTAERRAISDVRIGDVVQVHTLADLRVNLAA